MNNTKNVIKDPTHGSNQILIFDEYVKVKNSLHTRHRIWIKFILNHIDTGIILLAWYIDPNEILKYRYRHNPIPIMWNPHYRYPNGINNDDTRPKLVTTLHAEYFYN